MAFQSARLALVECGAGCSLDCGSPSDVPAVKNEPFLASESILSACPSRLICHDLQVRFPDGATVLDGIDCQFAAGEIASLVGASGCGKTTLLRTLAGLQPISGGAVDIQPPANAKHGELAFVFQQPTLLPWRTALENVMLALQLCRMDLATSDVARRAHQELDLMELPQAAFQRYPHELSGGMKMRVSLARALVTRPMVLLLDEPFAALDDMSRTALGDLLLRRWDDRPFTAVLVTHNIAEAAMLSHRIHVLNGGKISASIVDNLPRPRDEQVRTSAQFGRLYAEISAALRQQPALCSDEDRLIFPMGCRSKE